MGVITNYLINKQLDNDFRGTAYSAPASYIGLLTCTKGARANSTAYALNDTIALIPAGKTRLQLYKCTTAGTTAASQPGGYVGAAVEAITDGTAVFTEQTTALTSGTSGIPAMAVEPSGGSYARLGLTQTLAGMNATGGTAGSVSAGTSGIVSNAATLTMAAPTGNWAVSPGGIWAAARFDALTVGNLLEVLPDVAVRTVANGDGAFSFAAGALQFGLA